MAQTQPYNTEHNPQPRLSASEHRIANAVVAAITPVLDARFTTFEKNMDKRFKDHMTELEVHYGNRHNEIIKELRLLREDYQKVFGDERQR